MVNTKEAAAVEEMESQALVDESPQRVKVVGVEERVGGEAWHGSLSVVEVHSDSKRKRGSSFKQVGAAFFGNLGTINTGMMFGFSAVTIPQLRQPDSFIQITDDEASWIASLSSVATPFGCILSGYLLDSIGRKRTIILTLMPMILGWFLISAATNVEMIYAGRLFVGLGSGMMGSPARVYTGEVTQPHLRGMLAAMASVGTSLGVTIQYIVGSFLTWTWLAFISGLIPSVGFIAAFFLPESPSWLINGGKVEEARAALYRLRGSTCDVESELQDLINYANKINTSNKEPSKTDTLRAVLDPSALKPFIILSCYFFISQFSGINPVTFYAVQIIQESGADMNKYFATIMLGLVRLACTVVACIMMRRCGRRPLTFFSSVFCGLSMFGLGSYMWRAHIWEAEGSERVATWFPVLNLFLFMAASTIGFLVVPWVMIGELYPSKGAKVYFDDLRLRPKWAWAARIGHKLHDKFSTLPPLWPLLPSKVRGIMGGMTTFVTHFFVFVVVKTFPTFQHISKHGTFLMYGTISMLGTIFFYLYLPETKGRSLQEIEDYFSGRTKTLKPPKKETTNNNNKPPL